MLADVLTKLGCERDSLLHALECGRWQLEPTEQAKLRKVEIRAGRHARKAAKKAASISNPVVAEDGCENGSLQTYHMTVSMLHQPLQVTTCFQQCLAQGAFFGSKELLSLSFAARLSLIFSYPILSYLSIYLISIFSYNITHRVTKSAQYAK